MIYGSLEYNKNSPAKGYTDRILEIDLSSYSLRIAAVPPEMKKQFIGGRGYCLKLVFDGTDEKTKFDSTDNVLAIAGGPFCGETGFPGTGKFIFGTISPLTSTFCDSNVGGHFFSLIKLSGFDAISITGKTDKEVLILVDGDKSEIKIVDAPETEQSFSVAENIIENFSGSENKVNTALVTAGSGAVNSFMGCVNSVYYDPKRKRCRSKQAGRGGTGTVMRNKGLWGIAVKNNSSKSRSNSPVAPEKIRKAGKELRKTIKEVDPGAMRMYAQGTTSLVDMMNEFDILPVHNYQYGRDEKAKEISGEVFEKKYFKQGMPDGCFPGCTLSCTKGCESYKLKTGPYKGSIVAVDGPEYETAATASNVGIFDPDYIMEYSWYCDEYGLDTISVGVTFAFLFEAYDRGFISKADTDGLGLAWGSSSSALILLHNLAAGKGFAAEAGKGIRHMKDWISQKASQRSRKTYEDTYRELSDFGMECKGLEFSLYITKESLAQQGGYGFALKGAQHDESWLIALDLINKEMPTFKLKAEALMWFPLFRTWFNLAGLCKLPWIDIRHPEAKNTTEPSKNSPTIDYYLDLVNATLGTKKTLNDLLVESERSYLLHKLINLRQGFGTRIHDQIPLRAMAPVYMNEFIFLKERYEEYLKKEGVDLQGKTDKEKLHLLQTIRINQYGRLCDAVYSEKGYDLDGIPFKETLFRLGLEDEKYLTIIDSARKKRETEAAQNLKTDLHVYIAGQELTKQDLYCHCGTFIYEQNMNVAKNGDCEVNGLTENSNGGFQKDDYGFYLICSQCSTRFYVRD